MTSWPDRKSGNGVEPGLEGKVLPFSPKLGIIIGARIGGGQETTVHVSKMQDAVDKTVSPMVTKTYDLHNAEQAKTTAPWERTTETRALREAQMLAKMTDLAEKKQDGEPPFPRFVGMTQTEDTIYLHMEQGAPRNVEQLLDSGRRFSPDEVFLIMRGVLKGLAYMQELGIVHRDVRTANVLFDPENPTGTGRPMLLDLSIAESLSEIPISVYGANNRGTLTYIAPEQAAGPFESVLENRASATLAELESRPRSEISFATDTLGAGLVLFELLGEHLAIFHKKHGRSSSLFQLIYMSQPGYASELPSVLESEFSVHSAFVDVFRRAIAFDPKDRFQTAKDFYVAFAQAFKTVYGYVPPEW